MRPIAEVPSHSVEAEQSVLGALFLDNGAIDRLGSLKEDDLYVDAHRAIFRAAQRLILAGHQADVITVFDGLQSEGKAEHAGGLAYLSELAQNTPSAASAGRYAEIVRMHADRRAFVAALRQASDAVVQGSDLVGAIDQAQAAMIALTERRQLREPKLIAEIIERNVQQIDLRFQGNDGQDGLRTGLPMLDRRLNGLRAGELTILAGRPGMGKTALALQISANVATDENSTGAALFLSQEMEAPELGERALAMAGSVPFERILSGQLEEDDWPRFTKGIADLAQARLLIDDSAALTLRDVRSKAMATKRKHGLALVVIDYLQLMRGSGENRTQEVGGISRGLKALAKELKVPFLVLSQLSRKCEDRPDKRPWISDLRESGDIEQDADCVLLVFRPTEYDESFQPADLMEVNVAKKRNGKKGVVPLSYRGDLMQVRSYAGDWPIPTPFRFMQKRVYPGGLE